MEQFLSSSEASVLRGPRIEPSRMNRIKRRNLELVLKSWQTITQNTLKVKKKIYIGHYSDVYLIESRLALQGNNSEDFKQPSHHSTAFGQLEKLVLKIVNYEWCPKTSNYHNELKVSRFLKNNPHPNLIKIIDLIDYKEKMFGMVMSYGGRMDLLAFQQWHNTSHNLDSAATVKKLFIQLLQALHHLHSNNIVHRDIKPENVLVKKIKSSKDFQLQLIDFGFSKMLSETSMESGKALCISHKGTLEFMAPELLENCLFYDAFKTDIYSLGVILYEMLYTRNPFQLDKPELSKNFQTAMENYRILKSNPIKFPINNSNQNRSLLAAQDLIRNLLHVDCEKRPTLEQIKKHAWFD